jgi:hypothetical protein
VPDDDSTGINQVEWPTLATLKEEGDGRRSSERRMLPKPRLNRVSRDTLKRDGSGAYNEDGTIPWRNKEILATGGRVLPPGICNREVHFMQGDEARDVDEMRLREMPPYLREMLLWLFKTGGDGDQP